MKIRKNKELRQGFQKHRMLFNTSFKSNDGLIQLLVTNSHEGSTALRFQLGYYRYVCSNGLVVGRDIVAPISVRHTLENTEKLNDTIAAVLMQKNKVIENIDRMQAKIIQKEDYASILKASLDIRGYNKDKYGILTPIFEIKRLEDQKADAFTVLNVIQENLLRTGFKAENERNEKITMRAIKSLDEQNRINSELWDLLSRAA